MIVLALYVVLVATHRGEFWPASIYPMFSRAGRPWTRALVRELDAVPSLAAEDAWQGRTLDELPGRPFALVPRGIGQNDVANFISKTEVWDDARVAGLRSLFAPHLTDRPLLFYAVRGHLDARAEMRIECTPMLLLTKDRADLAPHLRTTAP